MASARSVSLIGVSSSGVQAQSPWWCPYIHVYLFRPPRTVVPDGLVLPVMFLFVFRLAFQATVLIKLELS